MRLSELQKKILTAIKSKLSHKDLCSLCTFNEISSAGLKRSMQERLELFMHNQSYNQLLLINNKIDEFINGTKKVAPPVPQVANDLPKYDNSISNYIADTLNDNLLSEAPIKLDDELTMVDRNAIVILQFTTYPGAQTPVPTQTVTGINERMHIVRMPNMLPNISVQISPFYCCATCLHPLSLLIPQIMPNIPQNNRITSHSTIQFSLSDDAHKLITTHSQVTNAGKKLDFKWQVLLRFITIDPTLTLPTPGMEVPQYMPPYLNITVNNELSPLWEVLPSNCKVKEGKRHPKAVNISDKLNLTNHTKNGYRQNIQIDWWQTPGVFQYYYVGVYLERKLSVREILDLFATNRHVNDLPIDSTLNLIKSKLGDSKYRNAEDDDDLVVSSVLPISLSCPVGRSRIEIPIRSLRCQHLQCFDANLFLCMNERRSIWKCPVCETSAKPSELFCDKYFQEILLKYKDNDNVNDINVSSDGSYVPVFKRNKEDKNDTDDKQVSEGNATVSSLVDTAIILDSDDESDPIPKPRTPSNKAAINAPKRSLVSTPSIYKPKPSKLNLDTEVSNINGSVASSHTSVSTVNTTSDTSKANEVSNVTVGPSRIRITAPLSSSSNHTLPRPNIPLSSNSFTIPHPTYNPLISTSRTPISAVPAPNAFQTMFAAAIVTTSETSVSSSSSFVSSNATVTPSSHLTNQKVFQISSLIQSSSPIPTRSPIAALPQTHVTTPLRSSISNPIPAPNETSSIIAAIKASTVPSPSLNNDVTMEDSSAPNFVPSLCSNPMKYTTYEPLVKPKIPCDAPPHTDAVNKSTNDRYIGVVRTPPTTIISNHEQTSKSNFVTQPISCPAVITEQIPAPKSTEILPEVNNAFTKPQESRREAIKRSKPFHTKMPSGAVNIPTVSIDLTESDEEEPIVTDTPLNNSNGKWSNLKDPSLRAISSYNGPNKYQMIDKTRMAPTRMLTNNNISHYKTHRVLPSLTNRAAINQKPIDLTETDDEDNDTDTACPSIKRPRLAVGLIEEGQINDSDEDSISSLVSSSTSSSSSDSVKKLSSRMLVHHPVSSSGSFKN